MIQHKSKNIKFCAYLRYRGIHPNEVDKFARGRAIYIYAMDERDWTKLKLDFDSSDYIEYANCLEAIKDLAY